MPRANSLGRFITVEGVDGAGKSTHIATIAERARARGHEVVLTREPGGTPLAERLRELLLAEPMDAGTETLLMFAARADHVKRVIAPALEAGRWVVCDRFTDTTLAYQGAGKRVCRNLIERLANAAHPGLAPDHTLVFDCAWPVARERLAATGRPLDRFEREDEAFFNRVRACYLEIAAAQPQRIKLIDAGKPVSDVEKQVEIALIEICL